MKPRFLAALLTTLALTSGAPKSVAANYHLVIDRPDCYSNGKLQGCRISHRANQWGRLIYDVTWANGEQEEYAFEEGVGNGAGLAHIRSGGRRYWGDFWAGSLNGRRYVFFTHVSGGVTGFPY